jgi:hypothetical protein
MRTRNRWGPGQKGEVRAVVDAIASVVVQAVSSAILKIEGNKVPTATNLVCFSTAPHKPPQLLYPVGAPQCIVG